MMRKIALPLTLAAALAVHDAQGGVTPGVQFTAKAVVAGNCTVTQSGTLDFGNYDPLTANASAAQAGSGASLSILCTRGSHPLVSMDPGLHTLAGTRNMTTGAGGANQALPYTLLQPQANGSSSASTNPWGNTAANKYDAGVTTVAPTTPVVVQIFGSIPAGQDVVPGTYNDTVTATVEY